MPVPMLKKLANKTGKSVSKAEKYWEDAKISASKKFSKKDSHYWAYVTSIVKKRLGVSEEKSASFKQFLVEQVITAEMFCESVKDECSDYLRDANGLALYRGKSPSQNFIFFTPENRKIMSSTNYQTALFNLYAEKKWKYRDIRIRNAIFATGNDSDASAYGPRHFIFLPNKFRFVWSPRVRDYYGYRLTYKEGWPLAPGQNRKFEDIVDKCFPTDLQDLNDWEGKKYFVDKLVDVFNGLYFTNTNMHEAIKSQNEITVQTSYYFAIRPYQVATKILGVEDYLPDYLNRKDCEDVYKKLLEKINEA
jgi:hypothetical protein